MPRFLIIHNEAVWERSCWYLDAANEEEAREKFRQTEGITMAWKEVEGAVDGMDDEIESIEEVEEDEKDEDGPALWESSPEVEGPLCHNCDNTTWKHDPETGEDHCGACSQVQ